MKRNKWITYKRPVPIKERAERVREATKELGLNFKNNRTAYYNNKIIKSSLIPDDKVYMVGGDITVYADDKLIGRVTNIKRED